MNEIRIEAAPDLPSPREGWALRTAAGLTVTQLGAIVGVSAASIRYWEAGVREPRGLQRIAYARALGRLAAETKGDDE